MRARLIAIAAEYPSERAAADAMGIPQQTWNHAAAGRCAIGTDLAETLLDHDAPAFRRAIRLYAKTGRWSEVVWDGVVRVIAEREGDAGRTLADWVDLLDAFQARLSDLDGGAHPKVIARKR